MTEVVNIPDGDGEVVLCPDCQDWTVLDSEGTCPMCGQEYVHHEHDDWDMER